MGSAACQYEAIDRESCSSRGAARGQHCQLLPTGLMAIARWCTRSLRQLNSIVAMLCSDWSIAGTLEHWSTCLASVNAFVRAFAEMKRTIKRRARWWNDDKKQRFYCVHLPALRSFILHFIIALHMSVGVHAFIALTADTRKPQSEAQVIVCVPPLLWRSLPNSISKDMNAIHK